MIAQNQNYILQLKNLLLSISEQIYTQPLKVLSDTSLSKHIRHILEFYQCLLAAENLDGVNYDSRKRDTKIECDLAYTIGLTDELIRVLSFQANRPLKLKGCSHEEIETTFDRELIYLAEHTVHHFALIKIGLNAHFPEIVLDEDFGYAKSTLEYLASCK
jgi:hypothetical protein